MQLIAPPPWRLKGRCHLFVYNFPKDFIQPPTKTAVLSHAFTGGIGGIMLIDYQESPVGPYFELLIIPGKVKYKQSNYFNIHSIYVSSEQSVENGRKNWFIPKYIANFKVEKLEHHREHWRVFIHDHCFFDAIIQQGNIPFPVHTALHPYKLLQWSESAGKITPFHGYGIGKLSKIKSIQIDPNHFPDVTPLNPILGMSIQPFHILFSHPQDISYAD